MTYLSALNDVCDALRALEDVSPNLPAFDADFKVIQDSILKFEAMRDMQESIERSAKEQG